MLAQDFRFSLEKELGIRIKLATPIGGGCISEACRLELHSGDFLFLKFTGAPTDMFEKEARALKELAKAKAIGVPEVKNINPNYLLLEYISPGRKVDNFWENFGQSFAKLHKFKSNQFGFSEDNFIGLSPQKNMPQSDSWQDFYWENRLLFQLKLAEEKGHGTSELNELFHNLEAQLPSILKESEEEPSLLHGDLWNGNFVVGPDGKAWILDPASYYGHREADLAMTKLFGGFTPEFYEGYQAEYPLAEGWEYRENLYKLYHIMNHLNIFGSSYYGQAIQLLRSYL
jgi:fructosamine-3-kinase